MLGRVRRICRDTSLAVGLVAGLLIGLAIPALRVNHYDAERLAAVRELVANHKDREATQEVQLRECMARLSTLMDLSTFQALSQEVKP